MEKQRIHELGFQNNEEEIFIINDADGDDNFAYGVELKTSDINQGQLVTGRYNDDTNIDNYAVVVGGGSDELHRRNLYTLDNSGNATFGGTVKVTRGGSTAEVATQQDLRNAAAGKFHSLDEPINITVNLDKAGAGAIQTGGEDIVVGITPNSVLSKAHGGTGRAILDNDSSQQAVLRGNMESIKPTGTESGSPDFLLGWDENKNLGIYPYSTVSGTGIPPKLYVNLSKTDTNLNPEGENADPYLGVQNELPIGKINFNVDTAEYNDNTLTSNHKMPFFIGNNNEVGTSKTVFIGLSSLRKALGITATLMGRPQDPNSKIEAGKLGRNTNNNTYTSHTFDYSDYTSIQNIFVTVSRGSNSYAFILNSTQTSLTFDISDYGLTSSAYTFKGELKQDEKKVTLTFAPNDAVLVNCSIIAVVQY